MSNVTVLKADKFTLNNLVIRILIMKNNYRLKVYASSIKTILLGAK